MAEATGRAKGGIARAKSLSPERRREIARKAVAARWDEIKQATHGSEDHPLKISDIEIPCYVLEDGRRVLQQTGLIQSLNMSHGGSYSTGGDRLAKFAAQGRLSSFVYKDLTDRTANPIRFKTPTGSLAYGYEATILADLCDAILSARSAGVLQKQQRHIAERAEILVRGFARVGIIALIDEATGFQRDRAKDALTRILEAFIAKELQPWLRTFPADFYQEMYRLRDMEFPDDTVQRPRYFGLLTNDIVYDRLAPDVLKKLKEVNPKQESGRRKHKYFQWLTSNVGYPKLREHLGSVVAIMKLSADWHDFRAKLDRLHPSYKKPTQLSLEFADDEPDSGKGL
jgi:P63C domain